MNITHTYIAPLWPPALLLAAINLSALVFPLPVLVQMLANACLSIHLACLVAASLAKVAYHQVQQCEEELLSGKEEGFSWSHIWEIVQYPLMGCLVLLGLYYLITNSQKMTVQTLMDIAFIILTVFYGGAKIHALVLWLFSAIDVKEKMSPRIWNLLTKVSQYILSPLLALLIALLYVDSKHWLLNNIFGLFLTINAIKYGGIKSFKLVVPILWTLFIYDMYWVYSSDVMVTVAKGIDLPLKLQFPYIDMAGQIDTSILGLGDIILPGLFLSLCFKYDIDNCIVARKKTKMNQFGMKLYNIAFGFYLLGLLLTYLALYVFNHAQPALVFIVPCLTISLFFNRLLGKRIPLLKYNSSTMAKREEDLQRI